MPTLAQTTPLIQSPDCTEIIVNFNVDINSPSFTTIANRFAEDGFVVFENVLDCQTVSQLNDRLEAVLRGKYDRGCAPDKRPKIIRAREPDSSHNNSNGIVTISSSTNRSSLSKDVDAVAVPKPTIRKKDRMHDQESNNSINRGKRINDERGKKECDENDASIKSNICSQERGHKVGPLGFSGNRQNVRVLQIINVHKCDNAFRRLATNPILGNIVAKLAGWKDGARLAQDQVWAKPPGAPPLVFHRDSPYFMFNPPDVVTVWVALDDMDEEIGPLEYVRGSHLWGDARVGSSKQFFDSSNGGTNLLRSAAAREGIEDFDKLEFVSMKGLRRGGISVHNGRTWHGSGKNNSKDRPRRGVGIHFVPVGVKFTKDALKSRLWRNYVDETDVEATILGNDDFPVTWRYECNLTSS